MKILFITPWYPTNESTVSGVFVREYAKAVRLYDEVVVIHVETGKPPRKKLWCVESETDDILTEGITTYRVRYRWIRKVHHLLHFWSVFQTFRKIISSGFHPDIIHAHVYRVGLPAVLIGKLYHLPVVVTEHFSAFPRRILADREIAKARFIFQKANAVLPVSGALQKGIQSYGIKARFQVVPNVVDTGMFYPAELSSSGDVKKLLLVAMMGQDHIKGIPYLLQALVQLQNERSDWHLDIVGDGVARSEYEQMTYDQGLSDRVTFHGLKSKKEVAEFMRKADVLVVPSLFETFCCVAAEALATGTPVLATRCGGPDEFITKDVGRLVYPGDAKALFNGLKDILNNLDSYSVERIHQYALSQFSLEQIGAKLHSVYEKITSSDAHADFVHR